MFSELILIHRSGSSIPLLKSLDEATPLAPNVLADTYTQLHSFFFKTCLRQIAIVDAETASQIELTPQDEVHRGPAAYSFLLQVICGLHSPLVGETEVSGQFKNAVAAFPVPANPWGQQLKRMFQNLFVDAKRIRQMHLVDLGSQSYGSVLRREFKRLSGIQTIHVLGAGHLVEEILPWIAKDGINVHIHCRNPEKAQSVFGARADTSIRAIANSLELNAGDALIVAAPVTAAWMNDWMRGSAPSVVADLRADSSEDRIHSDARIINLSQVFNHITETQAHLEARKASALKAIDAAVHERNCYVEYRPFGWEDVCA